MQRRLIQVFLIGLVANSLVVASSFHEDESIVPNSESERQDTKLARYTRAVRNVNVPGFYDMIKDGNSLGINVLSGFVRVDKGAEAERSGLVGPRPLSVRIFGIPIYERGVRIRDPEPERPARPLRPEAGAEGEYGTVPEPNRYPPPGPEGFDEDPEEDLEERKSKLDVTQKKL